MQIDINEVRKLNERRREINSIPFDEVEWVNGDVPLKVSASTARRWKFIGLSNCNFGEFVEERSSSLHLLESFP